MYVDEKQKNKNSSLITSATSKYAAHHCRARQFLAHARPHIQFGNHELTGTKDTASNIQPALHVMTGKMCAAAPFRPKPTHLLARGSTLVLPALSFCYASFCDDLRASSSGLTHFCSVPHLLET